MTSLMDGQPAAQTKARIIPDRGDDADGDGGD